MMARSALKASRLLVRDFGEIENLLASPKQPEEFAAVAARRTEKILCETLHELYPTYNFLVGSSGITQHGEADPPCWIIDPLDGTQNFLHGLGHFSINIALREGSSITAGIVYNPLRDELFWAQKGIGTFLNQQRIRVSGQTQSLKCILAAQSFGHQSVPEAYRALQSIAGHVAGVRSWGATSLDCAYVASGRCDGIWLYKAQPWEIAAGMLLIKEAGGFVTDHHGGTMALERGDILAGNERIHAFLLRQMGMLP